MKKEDNIVKIPVKTKSSNFADPLKYKIVKDESSLFTREKAFEFLELATFQGERPVRERHVQFLYDEWSAGRFLWQNVMLASATHNGKVYRINGQHCCWMRVNIPMRYEPVKEAVCREMQYQVENDDQMRSLYSAFDRNAPRSPGHIARVLLIDTQAGRDIPTSYLNKLSAGFKIYFSDDWRRTQQQGILNPNELAGIINKSYAEHFNLVGRFLAIHYSETEFIKRASVLGAMFATFEKNIQKSDDFWSAISNGLGLTEKTDARYQLRRYLETHGHTIGSNIEKVGQEEMYCVCLNAWNHWRSGQAVEVLRTTNTRPKVRS